MKIIELLQPQLESKKLDEILPALGMAAARLAGPALARAMGGASTLGRATAGATNATKALKAANSLNNVLGQNNPQQPAQDNKLKSTLSKLRNTLGLAGGPPIDVNKTSQTLTKPVDPSKPDPSAAKNLQPLIPGLSQALQHPQSAELISQAIQTGVKAGVQQQAKDQQDQAKELMKSVKN